MNLVQKLPIGLCLACLMMMSSSSKEDMQSPEPLTSEKTDASMRGVPPIITGAPYLAPTYGQIGNASLPNSWSRDATFSNDPILFPTGISTSTHLFGLADSPWVKPLSPVGSGLNGSPILTVSTNSKADPLNWFGTSNKRSGVTTTLKNLVPGKLYKIKFYVATTLSQTKPNNLKHVYADFLMIDQMKSNVFVKHLYGTGLDASNQGDWIPQEIIINANENELTLNFSAFTSASDEFAYAHILVDNNSVKEYQAPILP